MGCSPLPRLQAPSGLQQGPTSNALLVPLRHSGRDRASGETLHPPPPKLRPAPTPLWFQHGVCGLALLFWDSPSSVSSVLSSAHDLGRAPLTLFLPTRPFLTSQQHLLPQPLIVGVVWRDLPYPLP